MGDNGAKKSHAQLIAEAAEKVRQQSTIFHFSHLEETPLPIGFDEAISGSSFAVAGDCCGMVFADAPRSTVKRTAENSDPYTEESSR